jgi:hypothetical protein
MTPALDVAPAAEAAEQMYLLVCLSYPVWHCTQQGLAELMYADGPTPVPCVNCTGHGGRHCQPEHCGEYLDRTPTDVLIASCWHCCWSKYSWYTSPAR